MWSWCCCCCSYGSWSFCWIQLWFWCDKSTATGAPHQHRPRRRRVRGRQRCCHHSRHSPMQSTQRHRLRHTRGLHKRRFRTHLQRAAKLKPVQHRCQRGSGRQQQGTILPSKWWVFPRPPAFGPLRLRTGWKDVKWSVVFDTCEVYRPSYLLCSTFCASLHNNACVHGVEGRPTNPPPQSCYLQLRMPTLC